MVYSLKKYHQHLLGRKIVVCTDHAAFTFLKKTLEPIGQQGRWLDLLSEYDIDIQHRPGHVHSNSDALSRRPCEQSGGDDCQQCLRTIAGSGAAQASGMGTPAPGLVQPSDNPQPSLPNSCWEESYELPQWFITDSPKADSSLSSSFLSLPTSTNQVAIPDGLASPDAPLSDSPATNTVT